jgi:hypothetical protein
MDWILPPPKGAPRSPMPRDVEPMLCILVGSRLIARIGFSRSGGMDTGRLQVSTIAQSVTHFMAISPDGWTILPSIGR